VSAFSQLYIKAACRACTQPASIEDWQRQLLSQRFRRDVLQIVEGGAELLSEMADMAQCGYSSLSFAVTVT
jgi:hypothetical protein